MTLTLACLIVVTLAFIAVSLYFLHLQRRLLRDIELVAAAATARRKPIDMAHAISFDELCLLSGAECPPSIERYHYRHQPKEAAQ